MHPLSQGVVLGRPEVRRSDDDPETAIQVRNPGRSFTGSKELTSDSSADRVRECGGRGGLVAGDVEAGTVKGDQAGMIRGRPPLTTEAHAVASLPGSARRPSLEDVAFKGMEAPERRRPNEFVPTIDQVNRRHRAGLGITCHEPRPATALLNASRPSVRRELPRPNEGPVRVLHLDRRLGVVVAAANLRAPRHDALTQRVQARHSEGLRHVKQVVVC
jgi:hypothetical protein